jgi:hypothetical protein
MIPEGIAVQYLRQRGITPETVAQNKIEIRPSTGEERVKASEYHRRLGFDHFPDGGPALHEAVSESIWFACRDANTNILSWIVRPFHSLNGTTAKFLAAKENGSYPYIPQRTWDVAFGDLAETNPDRVQDARTGKSRDWIIKRPVEEDDSQE